jgi:hypothetical protein
MTIYTLFAALSGYVFLTHPLKKPDAEKNRP